MRNKLEEPDRGALARLIIEHGCWVEEVPPLPAGHAVTVAFSTPDLAAEHAEAIERLGYRVVGAHEEVESLPTADFLVPEALIESHPAWWRALVDQADRVYVLELGPARWALSAALRVHLHG
jgi:hypothetical protein